MISWKWTCLVAVAIAVWLPGCSTPGYVADSQNSTITQISLPDAIQTIMHYRGDACIFTADPNDPCKDDELMHVAAVQIEDGNAVLQSADRKNNLTISLSAIASTEVPPDLSYNMRLIVTSGPDKFLLWADNRWDSPSKVSQRMQNLANSFLRLSHFYIAQKQKASDTAFADVAGAYRNSAVKPAPGEDVRRLRVQAVDAVKQSRFSDAANLYGQALAVAPWWPAGHHDRAFVLAELGRNREAVVEMQRYLELVPDAPDARAMRDQIYVWQGREAAGQASPYPGNASTATVAQPSSPPSGGGSLGGTLFQGVMGGGQK